MATLLVLLPRILLAEFETTEPEAESPGVLPERIDPPFLAIPYQAPESPPAANAGVAPAFLLPAVDRFLPPRAVPVPTLRLRGLRFEGNTIFNESELQEQVEGFIGRELTAEDLDQLRHELTLRHVAAGYLNSGASIPNPNPADGMLTVRITEGRLTEVLVKGNDRLSTRYLRSRILAGNDRPLRFPELQQRLQVLQGNPNIGRLNAELKPGPITGEALMLVHVEESQPWSYGLDVHNQRSPSVGGEQAELWLENRNLSGYSDLLRGRLGLFSGSPGDLEFAGLDNLSLDYQRPLSGEDTTLVLGGSTEDYSVLEEPFRGLAIEGRNGSLRGGLRHPVLRTLNDEWWASLILEKSHDETSILGRPFSISPGSVNGELDLTVLRLGSDWTRRSLRSVWMLRCGVACGLDALGATNPPTEPDSEFIAFTLDAQYSRRLNERGDILVAHGGCQFAGDPLPPPAQFRIGGRYSVRGYRENYLVRDNGINAGVDYQLQLAGGNEETGWSLWMVPFLDAGIGWNDGGGPSDSLLSIGLGLRATYGSWFRGEIFYGHPLTNRPQQSGNLQDDGLHFRMSLARF